MFLDRWGHSNLTYLRVFTKDFALYGVYCSNRPLWKIHDVALINFDCFTTDQSNQVKISREIRWFQGYFLKIALRTRLDRNTTKLDF